MKPSIYNFSYKRENGSFTVFNTFSKSIIVFDNENQYYQLIDQAKEKSVLADSDNDSISSLVKNGFLVPNGFDELRVLRYFHYKTKFSNDRLILTIAPTMQCNFQCPYCYENARIGHMSEEVQDAILHYIKDKIEHEVKDIDITWYGGEPLLYPDIIDHLSSAILSIASESNKHVHFTMVTNGSLLTPKIVEMLERNHIHSIQITLDGLRDNHNARRPFRGGQGSYDRIINNIPLFKGTSIKVNIRMNVDRNNMLDFSALSSFITSMKDEIDISIYPAIVEHLNEDDNRENTYLSGKEYASFIKDCVTDHDIDPDGMSLSSNRRYYCTAELENCYVIDELGNFYKCWDEIGKDQFICFNVLNPKHKEFSNIARFVADDPFSSCECASCQFLPLCFGGCRYQKNYFQQTKCPYTRNGLIDFLEKKYFS